MMCSSSTCYHALRKARMAAGQTVAVFGAGGLGMSAIQLARACGALEVYAVDINEGKLELARSFGAIPVNAARADPVAEIRRLTGGKGVDVALELVGLPETMRQSMLVLGVLGRAALVGLTQGSFPVYPYSELLGKEAEVIGSSDHLLCELPTLLEFGRQGKLDLARVITRTLPLEAGTINEALDGLARFGGEVRTVIVP